MTREASVRWTSFALALSVVCGPAFAKPPILPGHIQEARENLPRPCGISAEKAASALAFSPEQTRIIEELSRKSVLSEEDRDLLEQHSILPRGASLLGDARDLLQRVLREDSPESCANDHRNPNSEEVDVGAREYCTQVLNESFSAGEQGRRVEGESLWQANRTRCGWLLQELSNSISAEGASRIPVGSAKDRYRQDVEDSVRQTPSREDQLRNAQREQAAAEEQRRMNAHLSAQQWQRQQQANRELTAESGSDFTELFSVMQQALSLGLQLQSARRGARSAIPSVQHRGPLAPGVPARSTGSPPASSDRSCNLPGNAACGIQERSW